MLSSPGLTRSSPTRFTHLFGVSSREAWLSEIVARASLRWVLVYRSNLSTRRGARRPNWHMPRTLWDEGSSVSRSCLRGFDKLLPAPAGPRGRAHPVTAARPRHRARAPSAALEWQQSASRWSGSRTVHPRRHAPLRGRSLWSSSPGTPTRWSSAGGHSRRSDMHLRASPPCAWSAIANALALPHPEDRLHALRTRCA